MVHAASMSEYQIVMNCQPIIEYFGPNVQHIYLV